MTIEGQCDFCGRFGVWEGGMFADRGDNFKHVKERPKDWAALFPWNRQRLPDGCDFSFESLEQHGITTRFACPRCVRGEVKHG